MTKQEKMQYADKKPVAVYPMSNWGGVEILDILYGIEDYVVARWYGKSIHKVKINYNINHPSFRIGNFTIRLDECLRV